MQFEIHDNGRGIVHASGNLTAYEAVALRALFEEAFQSTDHVEIAFENVKSIDLACLQVVVVAADAALEFHKALTFSGRVPGAYLAAVQQAGLAYCDGCISNPLWDTFTQ